MKPLTNAVAPAFGELLKQLRKRMGMTQHDLAAAIGYSRALIGALERNERLPDIDAVIQSYLPVLGLQDEPLLATQLVELAALARGERPPPLLTFKRERLTASTSAEPEAVHRLPAQPTELLGRAAEVNELCTRLLGHSGRLLTLIGPPGIGKTTLALAVAERLQPHYRDGAVFVPLAAVGDATIMASTIGAAVGSMDGGPKAPQTRLVEHLRHKQMLLVLDNLEQIRNVAPLVAALVAECPGLCILATSRERLHLRAEQRCKVPPLDLAPAVDLFVQRAAAMDAGFRRTPQNQATLEAICLRLDCLPLALELCAAQVDLRSPAQLLQELQSRPLDLLVDGPHDFPPQHRTLRGAIQQSYALLTDDERALFRSLSVFAGGFDLPAVEQVSAWKQETHSLSLSSALHALIGKSLVHVETTQAGEQRFLLLETLREFAAEQLAANGEAESIRQRHFAAYLHFARLVDHNARGADALAWFGRLSLEHENIRAAWQWSLASRRFVDAAWLGVALCHSWHVRTHWREGAQWFEQLLPHRHELAPELRLALLLTLFRFWRALHNFQSIEQYGSELTVLRETCPSTLLRAAAWFYIGVSSPDPNQAVAAAETCLSLLREAGAAPDISDEFCFFADRVHLQALALIRYAIRLTDELGEYERAEDLSQASLLLFRQMENLDFISYALGNLGRLALVRGNLPAAQRLLQEAVTVATTVGNRMALGDWQPRLGIVTLYTGDAAAARRLLLESRDSCLPLGNDEYLAHIYGYLAEVALWEGNLAEADAWMAQSRDHQGKLRWLTFEFVDLLFVSACLATAQQAYLRAALHFGLAEQIGRRIGYVNAGPIRPQIEAAQAIVRGALGPAGYVEAFAAGQQMSLAVAFTTILAPGHVSGVHGTNLR